MEEDVNRKWENIKEIYVGTAEKVLGYKKRRDKEWITAETLAKID